MPKHSDNPPARRRNQRRRPRSRSARPRPFTPAEQATRQSSVPKITYPAQLPVAARRAEIAAAIRDNQVVIVAGETGSGKTTQLPKICLELGRGITGMIGHTQPRRIAARSVADRICEELGVELGGVIGYQVRFTAKSSPQTLVKLMTDGILLAEIQSDPLLLRYDTIIIDEAHERSLNIDFLLGYLARLLPRRPDLKLIITSATIDAARFAAHFGPHQADATPDTRAPVIEVSGRTYPVEIRYRPLWEEPAEIPEHSASAERASAKDQVTGILDAVTELTSEGPGDILVFLSGEGEIRDTQQALAEELGERYVAPGENSTAPGAIEVLPLFARLSGAEQRRIFQPSKYRRIVLATNIAETSLTVPGIRYVIDPGTARISRYSNKTKVQRLPIEPVSQASANQRAGRCGRVANGIAIRLYSADDFAARPEFTEPEIQRTSLAAVILQMAALGLGNVADFPFLDPPQLQAVRAGIQLLEEIGALQIGARTPTLTKIGRQLSRLPIDPRLGRMLLAAVDNGCASEVLVLVAAMSVQDVRDRPTEFSAQADQLHARFTDPNSDFLAYLNLWRYLRTQQRELSGSAFRRMCHAEYLHWLRFREWQDVVDQLRELTKPLGIKLRPLQIPSKAQLRQAAAEATDSSHNRAVASAVKQLGQSADTPSADAIHRSLLAGLLSNLGSWDERKANYLGARGTRFVIWPGSGLHRKHPDWVMAAELVETSRLFARTVAKIDPSWVEAAAAHLVKRSYFEPYWSSRRGAAMVHEKVLLYGLPVVADRRVALTKVGTSEALETARDMFIRYGLVAGQWRTPHAFQKHNAQQLATAQEVEQRRREHALVADDAAIFTFFAERIPPDITSGPAFDSWWKKTRGRNPELLNFTQDFLLGQTRASHEDFPDEWIQGDIRLPIEYHFDPGTHRDGLTIDIPVTLLPQLTDAGFDWLVPGMLAELTVATIRALPKPVRRKLVPAPDVAAEILPTLPPWEEVAHGDPAAPTFQQCFTNAARELRQVDITDADWAAVELPSHLQITFRVRSERGAVLDEGTSIAYLQRQLAPQTRHAVESVVKGAVSQALEEARTQLLHRPQQPQTESTAFAETGADLDTWPQLHTAELPTVIETTGPAGMTVRGYPAIGVIPKQQPQPTARNYLRYPSAVVYPGNAPVRVAVQVLTDAATQVREHRHGIIRLLYRELALPTARITSRWNGSESLVLAGSPYPNTDALVADLQLTAARNMADQWAAKTGYALGELRTEQRYQELRAQVREQLEDEVYRVAKVAVQIFEAQREVAAAIEENSTLSLLNTVTDVRDAVADLVFAGFLSATPATQLPHLPRYLTAGKMRIAKAAQNPAADDALAWQLTDISELLLSELTDFAVGSYDPQRAAILQQARWMLEELRVSLFAQQLGTAGKVSPQRIRKLLTH
ncbi:MAG: ATP-dependent RNA helicase HrpA [Trueperella sp.]|nr:ATP-dependent RNA helicase HrpA [Trueperella sp.]